MSDAAGAAMSWTNGECKNLSIPGDRGVAAVGFEKEKIFFAGGLSWSLDLMTKLRDSKGRWWGCKSNALECIGLLIPFLTQPDLLKNRFVILYVDNISLIYAWEKKYCKNDEETSILIRCLHVLESFLEAKVFVEHIKRKSNDMAVLVDNLSRKSTTTVKDLAAINEVIWLTPGGSLASWAAGPTLDWSLPVKLLADVTKILDQ